MRVAIYCRVSTSGQELDQQISACSRFCEYKGFDFEIFKDVGSGKNMKRQEFQDMLDKLRHREFEGVVVFRFDRLGRNSREVVTLFEELENKGIKIFSINENLDTSSPIGRAMREIIMVLAQLERENIAEATRQRLDALRNLGKPLGRPKGSKDLKQRKKTGYLLRYAKKGGVKND